MTPDAKLRMDVYQEGQRAYLSGSKCPYAAGDWRSRTWGKGFAAGKAYHTTFFKEPEPAKPSAWKLVTDELPPVGRDVLYRSSRREADEVVRYSAVHPAFPWYSYVVRHEFSAGPGDQWCQIPD